MKPKNIILYVTLLLLGLASCRQDYLNDDYNKELENEGNTQKQLQDSLVAIFTIQSSPELLLADRIICKNSIFILDLTAKEAEELHIPDDLYQEYLRKAEEMNKNIEITED